MELNGIPYPEYKPVNKQRNKTFLACGGSYHLTPQQKQLVRSHDSYHQDKS